MISRSRYYETNLYPLQTGVMTTLKQCGARFYLTGGTALSRGYYNHRYSDDLDFFVNNDGDYYEQVKNVSRALKDDGFFWDAGSEFISAENFTSFKVHWKQSDAVLKMDFVNDVAARFGKIIETDVYYKTDSIRNILANKLTAAYRLAAKDMADIREIAMRERIDWRQAINDARQKEAGIDLCHIASILQNMPEHEFKHIIWTSPPDWGAFKSDLQKIALDMLFCKH